jgi:predicted dehydrogenase
MLRGAIVGFGEVARNGHWPAYRASSDIRIVAVVDRSEDRRALAADLDPAVRTFAHFDDLVAWYETSADRLDFVDVCTPPALHAEPLFSALSNRWHVLCEKPFLLDPAMIDEARLRAREAHRAVLPVHNWKYAPIVRCATALLEAGAIGRLRCAAVEVTRLRAAPTAEAGRPNWRRDPVMAGGGILMDHGWHAVYLVLHWFKERAGEVSATLHYPAGGGVEDEAAVVIGFPAGRARIALTWNGDCRRNAIRLEGDAGELLIADDTLHLRGSSTVSEQFPQALSAGSHHDDWFAAMLPDVVKAFHQPDTSQQALEEAAETLSIIRHAYESAPAVAEVVQAFRPGNA